MVKNPKPQAEAEAPATPVETPVSEPISFEEPAAQLAEGAVITDEKPADFVEPVISEKEMAALRAEAIRDDKKRDFTLKVLAAREPKPEPVHANPVAPRVVEQTNAELEAGRALVAKHKALAAQRRPPQPDPSEGTTKAVFRPADYVPDQKKGQGNVNARTL